MSVQWRNAVRLSNKVYVLNMTINVSLRTKVNIKANYILFDVLLMFRLN